MASMSFMKLSNQAYKREYGNFVYFFNNLNACDMVFADAHVFAEKITRKPVKKTR